MISWLLQSTEYVAENVSLPVGLPVMVQDCRFLVCSDKCNTHALQFAVVSRHPPELIYAKSDAGDPNKKELACTVS